MKHMHYFCSTLTVALLASASAWAEPRDGEEMTPAAAPSDYEASFVDLSSDDSDPPVPAKELEMLPFELRGSLGYYANDEGDNGSGASFRFNKTIFFGAPTYGFQVDLLADGVAYSNLQDQQLDYADAEVLGLAIFGAADNIGKDGAIRAKTVSGFLSFGNFSGHYAKDSLADYEFVGMHVDIMRLGGHFSFSRGYDLFVKLRFMSGELGYGEQLGQSFNTSFGIGSLHVAVGKDVGFGTLRAFVRQSGVRLDGEKPRADYDRTKEGALMQIIMWQFRTGLALERVSGSPFGLSYNYGYRYLSHRDYVVEDGLSYNQGLGTHFVALTAEYF